jgi:predicted transcriptional regulator of viral defense system
MEATAGASERDSRAQAALRLEEYAATQHGYVTRAQANRAGVGDQMLRRLQLGGWLDRAEHGVYRMRGAHDLAWAPVWVAWLSLDPVPVAYERTQQPTEIVRGHTASTAVYGMGDLQPEPYELWTTRRRFVRRRDIRLRVGRLPRDDIRVVNDLPVTTPIRTLADLVTDGYDGGHVSDCLRDALRLGLIDRRDLPGALAEALRRTLPKSRLKFADPLARQFAEMVA